MSDRRDDERSSESSPPGSSADTPERGDDRSNESPEQPRVEKRGSFRSSAANPSQTSARPSRPTPPVGDILETPSVPNAPAQSRGSPEQAPGTRREQYVASFGSDDPTVRHRDLLDVKDEARAFARIASSRTTRLPLSVGVFGEWGSGKTFFMGLMSDHVKELSDRARKEGQDSLFLSDIVQIKFNAWHYIDQNLWASLVEYIFTELDRSLRESSKPADKVEKMFEQLSTSRRLKIEAIEDLIVRRRERKKAEKKLDDVRRDYEAALLRQSAATSTDFWKAVLSTFKDKLKSSGGDKQIEALARDLGLKDLSESADSFNQVLKEAETEAGRARVLNRAMVAKVGQWRWVFAIVLTLVVVPAGVVLLKDVLANYPGQEWIAKINGTVLALSSLIATASALFGRVVSSARGSLTQLESFRSSLDEAVKERTEEFKNDSDKAKKFAEAERDVARLRSEMEQAERKFVEADRQSDQILRDYRSATARGRLNAFIRDKITSGDYAKYLGLIATIRKDFEQLAQLMAEVKSDGAARKEYQDAQAAYKVQLNQLLKKGKEEEALSEEEVKEMNTGTEEPESGLFNRIILYIDDLDRCPPDKVVDVLQAIHLLLYFPLFVVVVAVDARWVSRSLREQFPDLLAENIIGPGRKRRGSGENQREADDRDRAATSRDAQLPTAATSHDYLEKIFQIPYWVRPMDGDASVKYVTGIAEADKLSGTQQTVPSTPSGEDLAYVARTMTLSDAEREFLKDLAPFVGGTPRRGLRFVNVYRLVKTSLPESLQGELDEDGNPLGYRALITQLAIVTGAPHLSTRYFELLESAAEAIETSGNRGDEDLRDLEKLVGRLHDELSTADGTQKLALLGALTQLHTLNERKGVDVGPELLLALDRFAPVARRFSFTARQH